MSDATREEHEVRKESESKGQKVVLSRRQALMAGAVAGAGLMMPWARGASAQDTELRVGPRWIGTMQTSPTLTKYIDQLRFPPIATNLAPDPAYPGYDRYNFEVRQFQVQMHTQLPPTTVWGYTEPGIYRGYLGPTIVATRGTPIALTVSNNLNRYVIPVDTNIGGVTAYTRVNPPIATHLHGGEVEASMDGGPFLSFGPGQNFTYFYPNNQQGSTLWYHDHGWGVTRLNVLMGIAGAYPIIDRRVEANVNLPKNYGVDDLPLILQDRVFNADGSIWYPTTGWIPEYFGDTSLVNGIVWPNMDVPRGWVRCRFVGGSNARFFNLSLNPPAPAGTGPNMYVVATDGSYHRKAIPLNNGTILVSPGERYEVMINFGVYNQGQAVLLMNDGAEPFPNGLPPVLTEIMQFTVGGPNAANVTPFQWDPATFAPRPITRAHDPATAIRNRYITLWERTGPGGVVLMSTINNLELSEGITEVMRVGDVEIWNIINQTVDAHPIHLHQVQFNVLSRQRYDRVAYLQANPGMHQGVPVEPYLLNTPNNAFPHERNSWKDTVVAYPTQVTRIIAKFGPYTGKYVYHCHILDHEDNEMMRPFLVTP